MSGPSMSGSTTSGSTERVASRRSLSVRVQRGALWGAVIGALAPLVVGATLAVHHAWMTANEPPYEGTTSVSYQNTPGGAWGYAVVSVLYLGIVVMIVTSAAASVGLLVGAVVGAVRHLLDAPLRRLRGG